MNPPPIPYLHSTRSRGGGGGGVKEDFNNWGGEGEFDKGMVHFSWSMHLHPACGNEKRFHAEELC